MVEARSVVDSRAQERVGVPVLKGGRLDSRPVGMTRAGGLFMREAGNGPPLLLLHGMASTSRFWEPQIGLLRQRYRVLAPDLFGFGRSPRPHLARYSAAEHLAALTAAVEARVHGPLTLVGHSMGAVLALQLAVTRPDLVHRLLLVSLPVLGRVAWGHQPDGRPHFLHRLTVHTRAGLALFDAALWALRPLWQAAYQGLRPLLPIGAERESLLLSWASYWRTLEAVVYGSDVPSLFAAAPGPVLLLHGCEDRTAPIEPVRRLAASRPDAHLIEVPGAGHDLLARNPRALQDALSFAPQFHRLLDSP